MAVDIGEYRFLGNGKNRDSIAGSRRTLKIGYIGYFDVPVVPEGGLQWGVNFA